MLQIFWALHESGARVKSVTTADQCTRSNLLAWVHYPYSGTSCYVYPQYLLDGDEWKAIEHEAFPNTGSFQAIITGGATPSDMSDRYGSIVVARVNSDDFDDNIYYEPEKFNSSQFKAAINPSFTRGASELEFEVLSDHRLSAELLQIVDIKDKASFLKPINKPVELKTKSEDISCRYILVRHLSCDSVSYFGPFEYVKKIDDYIELQATASNDYRIARIQGVDEASVLSVCDPEGNEQCAFLERSAVNKFLETIDISDMIDWIPQKELTETITRAINISSDFAGMSKNDMRAIKSAIWQFSDSDGQTHLDDSRKQRIIDWLSDIDNWIDLPDEIIKNVGDSIDEDKLAEIVLDESNYPRFKERIMNSAGVQERIDEERTRLEQNLGAIRQQTTEVARELDEAITRTEAAKAEASTAEEQLEKIRDDALAQRREELDDLEKEIGSRSSELDRLNNEYERAIVNKSKIEKDVAEIIGGINDEVATSTKILESEILRKVVSAVSGVDLKEDESESAGPCFNIRQDESLLSEERVVSILFNSLTERAGRQFSRNDAINLMLCFTQGYITTFSGLPGTGKTSLCNILAGALGLLNNASGKRFTEINVENGWTSYKDYIGYYNPLSKTFEKSNTAVFDAMKRLSKEEDGAGDLPPYLFLLDEANLSPIEHYWSPFLRACDSFEEVGAKLSLGGAETWSIPPYVRFVATVNFDHTTEALSHRFLDRSWVITLDPDFPDADLAKLNILNEFSGDSAFSSRRLLEVFGYKESDLPDTDNMQLFDDLMRVCKANSFAVSPRSRLMMRRYIASASRLMSIQSKDSQYAPLDYAFSQKVLPQLSGPAETVGPLIDELIDRCSELKVTKRHLDRMKDLGEDNGFYQYFV